MEEEDYFKENRKELKHERKRISAKDRSKYKKTDQKKLRKRQELDTAEKLSKEKFERGRVLAIISQGIIVEEEKSKRQLSCVLKGVLKRDEARLKNLVTIGDFVLFQETSEGEGVIAHVAPRRSVLSRADTLSRRKEQLIAANIDQVLITTSVVDPPLKPSVVDRYIIAAKKGNMSPVIVVNKMDLLREKKNPKIEKEHQLYQEFLAAYALAGVPVISVSVLEQTGLAELKKAMKNYASVFFGQSGTGKTSLINALTGLNLRVRKTVEKTKKGAHTTTRAQLIPLKFGGWCIDTPGVKSFGMWNLKEKEIQQFFSEIHAKAQECQFADCSHTHEANCAVRKAVEEGKISPLRYRSYQALLESASQEHLRR